MMSYLHIAKKHCYNKKIVKHNFFFAFWPNLHIKLVYSRNMVKKNTVKKYILGQKKCLPLQKCVLVKSGVQEHAPKHQRQFPHAHIQWSLKLVFTCTYRNYSRWSQRAIETQNDAHHIASAVTFERRKPFLKVLLGVFFLFSFVLFFFFLIRVVKSSSSQTALNIYLWVLEPDELWLHKQISCHSLQTFLCPHTLHTRTDRFFYIYTSLHTCS